MRTTAAPAPRPLRYLTFFGTCFSAICFFIYFLSVVQNGAAWSGCLLSLAALTVILLPPVLAAWARAHLNAPVYRVLRGFYACGVLFFTVSFPAFFAWIFSYTADPPVNEGPVQVLVYGCRVDGDRPGEMLRSRLDAAYLLLAENPLAEAIVSGGLDTGECVTEGAAMAAYLTERGIPAERILIDETAESTKGNIRAFLRIRKERGQTDLPAISVSSEFHMPRIESLCARYGLECAFFPAKTPGFGILFPSMVREYMAYVKMLLFRDAA